MIGFFVALHPSATSAMTSARATPRRIRAGYWKRPLQSNSARGARGSDEHVLPRRSSPEIHERDEIVDAVRRCGRDQTSRRHEEKTEAGAGGCRPQHVRDAERVEEAEDGARGDD